MNIQHIINEELNAVIGGQGKGSKVDEEHWGEFGSWHNNYPAGTKFEFDGNRWVVKEAMDQMEQNLSLGTLKIEKRHNSFYLVSESEGDMAYVKFSKYQMKATITEIYAINLKNENLDIIRRFFREVYGRLCINHYIYLIGIGNNLTDMQSLFVDATGMKRCNFKMNGNVVYEKGN